MIVYLDGRFLPAGQAVIPIDDRGFLNADGVFETALLHDGGFFRLTDHLERLRASAAMLQLPAPPVAELDTIARALVRENRLAHASLRFTLTRGTTEPRLLVTARPPDEEWVRRAARGWEVITARTRRPSPAAVPAQLKALGRTYALLARLEAAAAGADDALLLNHDGHVCEGPAWNVFWRHGTVLRTPALEAGVLAGVTRGALGALAASAGYTVEAGLFSRGDLDDADEIFASMTSVGVVSIRRLDARVVAGETSAAAALAGAYRRLVAEECAADRA